MGDRPRLQNLGVHTVVGIVGDIRCRDNGAAARRAAGDRGLVIGAVVACYGTTMVKTFLFEIEPNNVRILIGAVLTLAAAGLLASAVPARRAASVDPLVALRHE